MLEVIATSVADIKKINQTHADQIEFCVDIQHEGLSPNVDQIMKAIVINKKKLRIMLRMHFDNFYITKKQTNTLLDLISKTQHLNFDGYVFGAITTSQHVDHQALNMILEKMINKNITFHKAIDHTNDVAAEIMNLINHHNIKYILTAGGSGSPEDNKQVLNKIAKKYQHKILLGGGVSLATIDIMKKNGFKNYHIGRSARENNSYAAPISIEKINMFVKRIEQ